MAIIIALINNVESISSMFEVEASAPAPASEAHQQGDLEAPREGPLGELPPPPRVRDWQRRELER
ncbi:MULTISPECIES: hypothetical protein [Nocardiopsidaceae]|uniref:Transposase n=1 Tax=Streptomonospora nanhaiensis TaxID=1323731 RepID=A0ABY6YX73_9ACTN|nr:hypothetical protein [Streptomonospora nanhaiensis]WAE76839.1 hypothetical protein OUQ99_31515 [Streptomonospora nanhaiensis]